MRVLVLVCFEFVFCLLCAFFSCVCCVFCVLIIARSWVRYLGYDTCRAPSGIRLVFGLPCPSVCLFREGLGRGACVRTF